MQRQRIGRVGCGVAAAVTWIACGDNGDRATVAEVAGRAITAEQLRRFVMTLPPGLRTAKGGQEARADYLQTLIDRELMLLAAEERGLDRDPDLRRRLRRKVEDRVLALYRQRELSAHTEVTPQEVEDYVTAMGLAEERLLESILVRTPEEAAEITAALAGGAAFGELARDRSLDAASGARGGRVGYLNRAMAPRIGVPEAVFDTLRVNDVSPPLRWGANWAVIRFVDDRVSEAVSLRDRARMQLAQEARQELEDQQVELLAAELGWAPDPAGLRILLDLPPGSARIPELSPSQLQAPLFVFEGGSVTIQEYVEALREHRVRTPRAVSDSAFVVALGTRLLQPRALLLVAAARQGVAQDPGIVQWRAQVGPEMALQALRDQIVRAADSLVTEERIQTYYEAHRETFRVPAQVCFDEILFPRPEEAEQALAELDAAADLLALSRQRGNRIRRRRADGLLCVNELSKQVLPDLWAALAEAPVGQLRGPVSLDAQAWVLIKVARRTPARLQTLDEARPRARASLVARLQNERFDAWLDQERNRRQSDVRVSEDRLEAALPEALLAGTRGQSAADR